MKIFYEVILFILLALSAFIFILSIIDLIQGNQSNPLWYVIIFSSFFIHVVFGYYKKDQLFIDPIEKRLEAIERQIGNMNLHDSIQELEEKLTTQEESE